MFLTRKNAKGGPTLKSYEIVEDQKTGLLGYRWGYCEGCNEPLLIRTVEVREILQCFGVEPVKKREPIRYKIIRLLGGRIGD